MGEADWERGFRAGWEASGEGYNGEYPDDGVPWDESEGRQAMIRAKANGGGPS